MSAPFREFVQLELPKRPFLSEDVPQESVIVRRGEAPRQLSAVEVTEGQALVKIGGSLQSKAFPVSIVFTPDSPSTEWVVEHTFGNRHFLVDIFDNENNKIYADMVVHEDNLITIKFYVPLVGTAVILFV